MILWHLILTAAFFFLCFNTGLLILKWLRCQIAEPLENALFATLTGFIVHCYLIWFAGQYGFCGRKPLLIIYGLMLLLTLVLRVAQAGGPPMARSSSEHQWRWPATGPANWKQDPFWIFIFSVFALIVLQQLFSSHAPAVWRDDLSYHLYIPKAYLEMGRIQPPPFGQRQSFYHQIFNMSYLPLMAAGGEQAAKLANFFWQIIFVLLGITLYRRVAQAGGPPLTRSSSEHQWRWPATGPAVTTIGIYTAPGVLFISETAMTDLPAACFALGGILAYFLFEESRKSFPYLRLSAILAAFALNKYTAWSYFLATALIFAVKNFKNPRLLFKGLSAYGTYAFIFLAPLAFFLFIHTGNPIYPIPFFNLPHDSIEGAAQTYLQGPKNILVLIHTAWKDLFGGASPDSSALIALAPAAFLLPFARQGVAGVLILWAALAYLIRFFAIGESSLLFRYVLPSYAVLMLLAGLAYEQARLWGKNPRRILNVFLIAAILYPSLVSSTARSIGNLQLHFGLLDFDGYMRRFYPGEGWEMLNLVNALSEGSKTAVLDHHFTPYRYKNTASGLLPVSADILSLNDPESIRFYLKAAGATHVLFIPNRWHAVKTDSPSTSLRAGGFILLAKFMGPHLTCRWWEKGENLPFLIPYHQNSQAILFEFKAR